METPYFVLANPLTPHTRGEIRLVSSSNLDTRGIGSYHANPQWSPVNATNDQPSKSIYPLFNTCFYGRTPNIAPDTLPISCMVCNVQGAGSPTFISALKEIVRTHRPHVLSLVKTHMGGSQAVKVSSIIGYMGHTRVVAMGFSGGIWIYWRLEIVTLKPIIKNGQYITMDIKRVGAIPWYFTAIYASPYPTKLKELWD